MRKDKQFSFQIEVYSTVRSTPVLSQRDSMIAGSISGNNSQQSSALKMCICL